MPFDDVRRIVIRAREQGLVVTQNGGAIELAPRLDVPLEELEEGVEILDRSILGPVGSGSAASKAATGTSG
jgi:4-aminobutyrate aminotransferase-like enzyme